MKLSQLTFIGFYLNGAQGNGRHDSISIEDVKTELEKGTLFEYLQQELGQDIDTSPVGGASRPISEPKRTGYFDY